MHTLTIVTIEFAATAHLMMSLVMFRFARRSVNYLSQAWIMLLICLMYCGALFFVFTREIPSLGFLHPALLIYLLACSYLQSIYPLGLCMPGYLQWGRMWKYAAPALALIFIYILGALLGSGFARVYELSDVGQYLLSGDILLRFAALGLSGYYIANIFFLPHRLMRRFELPRDLIAYGPALGIVSLYFVILTLNFNLIGLTIYILFFTVVNMFLFFRIMRPVLDSMSYPVIREIAAPPTEAELTISETDDFNRANLVRFEALEYLMQKEKPFTDVLFTRDRLCRLSGFNRHLVLQCLRSQGYNDVHEYISRYRVAELRKMIDEGAITDLRQVDRVGFRTLKTAAGCFERYENLSLSDYLQSVRGK